MAISINADIEYAFSTQIMKAYDELMPFSRHHAKWNQSDEEELWKELALCVLSSNVPYEMAKSAHSHLNHVGLLDIPDVVKMCAEKRIAQELSKPICLPKRKNGMLRRYRFPNCRAASIAEAGRLFYCDSSGIQSLLSRFTDEVDARDFFAENVPGIGLKEASNFLRNVGFSNSLAIVDSHILSFMQGAYLIGMDTFDGSSKKSYAQVEQVLRDVSERNGLNLSVLDLAIWDYMRGR